MRGLRILDEEGRRGRRVGCPFVGQDLKVTEGRPREVPPCG